MDFKNRSRDSKPFCHFKGTNREGGSTLVYLVLCIYVETAFMDKAEFRVHNVEGRLSDRPSHCCKIVCPCAYVCTKKLCNTGSEACFQGCPNGRSEIQSRCRAYIYIREVIKARMGPCKTGLKPPARTYIHAPSGMSTVSLSLVSPSLGSACRVCKLLCNVKISIPGTHTHS